jgi:hypothetical protein
MLKVSEVQRMVCKKFDIVLLEAGNVKIKP